MSIEKNLLKKEDDKQSQFEEDEKDFFMSRHARKIGESYEEHKIRVEELWQKNKEREANVNNKEEISGREVLAAQKEAGGLISDYFQGDKEIEQFLDKNETELLQRMDRLYNMAKQNNPDQPVDFSTFFEKNPDFQEIYNSIINKLAKENIKSKQQQENQDIEKQKETSEKQTQEELEKVRNSLKTNVGSENQAGKDVETMFERIKEGASRGAKDKIVDYDKRIRAALAGVPIKKNDTFEGLKKDFKHWTKKDWSEDFDINSL
ncbi:hypothetical protein KKH38_02435 [Patescibacteria group bacterium]|nr:hypothetical protein [Patescibacteria group bacterium]MBU4600579.1 hypothetical protein [Patescibacteria group bacterium]MCG2698305.1 hypothetical protein [Candidatus Parcubacteria bacterium]MCG2700794.1 hypothetical protein [Candidatus Parcubacteria bacterium]